MIADTTNYQSSYNVEIMARICQGDQKALESLYHEFYPRLYRFISRIIWKDADIVEIINDVFMTVWEKASTFNNTCKLSTWIIGIAYNKARDAARTAAKEQQQSIDDLDEDSSSLGTYDEELEQLATIDELEAAIKLLSPEQQTVLELTFYQGLHYSEIAAIMNCPENTVKTRVHYARKILAENFTYTYENSG